LPIVGHDPKQYIATKLLKNKTNRRVHFAPRDEVLLIPYNEEDCDSLSNSSIIPLRGSEEDLDRIMESIRSSKRVSEIPFSLHKSGIIINKNFILRIKANNFNEDKFLTIKN